jgi:flavin-binding protein dodecin
MSVYRLSQFVGTSFENYGEATKRALAVANKVTPNMDWFEAVELGGRVRDGKMEFRVKIDVGHLVEQED